MGSIFALIIFCGVYFIRLNFFARGFHKGRSDSGTIAITFDDGPHPNTLPVLEVLRKHQAKATFFCIGKNIELYPEIFKQIVDEGHEIGNHSFSHSNTFPIKSPSDIVLEMEQTNEIIQKHTSLTCELFRPPFGVMNPRIAKALHKTEMQLVGWNVRSYDTAKKAGKALGEKLGNQVRAGDVVLLHDRLDGADKTLDQFLNICKSRNLSFLPVGKLKQISES